MISSIELLALKFESNRQQTSSEINQVIVTYFDNLEFIIPSLFWKVLWAKFVKRKWDRWLPSPLSFQRKLIESTNKNWESWGRNALVNPTHKNVVKTKRLKDSSTRGPFHAIEGPLHINSASRKMLSYLSSFSKPISNIMRKWQFSLFQITKGLYFITSHY